MKRSQAIESGKLMLAVMTFVVSGCSGGGVSSVSSVDSAITVIAPAVASPGAVVTPEAPASQLPNGAAVSSPSASSPAKGDTGALSGLLAEGDSISRFRAGTYTGQFSAKHPAIKFIGTAVSGSTIIQMRDRLASDLSMKPALVTVLIGANDLGDERYPDVGSWLEALWQYVAEVKASGASVAVATLLPLDDQLEPARTARFMSRRMVANDAIRAAAGNRFDFLIDFAADPTMGDPKSVHDPAWYKADGIHPTDALPSGASGQDRLESIYERALDGHIK